MYRTRRVHWETTFAGLPIAQTAGGRMRASVPPVRRSYRGGVGGGGGGFLREAMIKRDGLSGR